MQARKEFIKCFRDVKEWGWGVGGWKNEIKEKSLQEDLRSASWFVNSSLSLHHTHSPYFPFEILEEDRGLSQAGELQQDRRNQQWYTRMGAWRGLNVVLYCRAGTGKLRSTTSPHMVSKPRMVCTFSNGWGGGEKKCPWIKFYWNRAVLICLSTSMAAFKLHWQIRGQRHYGLKNPR